MESYSALTNISYSPFLFLCYRTLSHLLRYFLSVPFYLYASLSSCLPCPNTVDCPEIPTLKSVYYISSHIF